MNPQVYKWKQINFSNTIFIIVIMLSSFILCYLTIQPGHNWGGDFALYLQQSDALLNGSLDELYGTNKYSMDNSMASIGPYLYPNGFPFLIAPICYFYGHDFVALKALCAFFFILSIPIVFLFFKNKFENIFFPFFIIVFIAFHSAFVLFTNNVLSDLPFFFLSFSSILLIKKENGLPSQCLLGFIIFFSFFTRTIGICLIPTLIAFQITYQRKHSPSKLLLLIPYLIFAFLFLLTSFLLPIGNENHFEMFFEATPQHVFQNIFSYLKLIGNVFTLNNFSIIPIALIILFIILGILKSWREYLHLIVYIGSTMFILLMWEGGQGLRFIFPIIPFLIFFLVKGVIFSFARLGLQRVVYPILILFLSVFVCFNISVVLDQTRNKGTNSATTSEMILIYDYISDNIGPEEIIGFEKPRVLRLFTGINSINTDTRHFKQSVAKYLLIKRTTATPLFLKEFALVHEFEEYLIVRK